MNPINLDSATIQRYFQTALFLFLIFVGIESQVCS